MPKSNLTILRSASTLNTYEIENPIDWQWQCCCICTLPLEINPTKFNADNETMSYADFVIFKEPKSLRNIFPNQELAASKSIKHMKIFHAAFGKFLKIAILLPNVLNAAGGSCFEDIDSCFDDEDLSAFYRQTFADCKNFGELKEAIASAEVKHNARIKMLKFMLEIYAFAYQRLMDFSTVSGRFAEHSLSHYTVLVWICL